VGRAPDSQARALAALLALGSALATRAVAQGTPASAPIAPLSVDAIFGGGAFRAAPMPTIRWLRDGHSFLDVRPDSGGGSRVVRVDVATGATEVLVPGSALVDAGGRRVAIEDVAIAPDESALLLFHDTVRLWRTNTRGQYSIVDLATHQVTPLSRAPGLQMFAAFSPDGKSIAFARDHDLWVVDRASGAERRLTTDGSTEIINGTTDWVYEEELGLRDGFRWSPDSRRLAYWRFDQSTIPPYPLEDDSTTDPKILSLRYPVAGAPNSRVRVGVLDVASTATRWLDVGGDTGVYVARMDWNGPDSLVVERLPRSQNRLDLLMVSAASGASRPIASDSDAAYVSVVEPIWIDHGKQFLLTSDRSGWHAVDLFARDGHLIRQVTADGSDVLSIEGVDEARGTVYVVVAAPDATQRQIVRYSLRGGRGEPLTTTRGAHAMTIAPGAQWAVDVHSTLGDPPTATVYALPAMRPGLVLVDNAVLRARLAAAGVPAPTFFHVPAADGTPLDGYRIAGPGFDSTTKHPVLMYVYGGPANPTVVDQWGGSRYLWHAVLAQMGYVVVSVDNRGAAWRGRVFRKMTQRRLGEFESADQVAAARWIGTQPWADPARIGIWGWSYGGYLASRTAERGGPLFKAAISVAPVTDWRLYDNIYTERYMGTPADNAAGYDSGSVQRHVGGLSARLLLVHGTGDDNVHPQNSVQYAAALEAAGKPFYMLLYPNRTHAISGGNSQRHLFESLTQFLREQL